MKHTLIRVLLILLLILWLKTLPETRVGPFFISEAQSHENPLIRLDPSDYPLFADDLDLAGLEEAFGRSIQALRFTPPATRFRLGPDSYSAAHILRTLENLGSYLRKQPTGEELNAHLRKTYLVYRFHGQDPRRGTC